MGCSYGVLWGAPMGCCGIPMTPNRPIPFYGTPMTPMNIYGIPTTPMNINGIPTAPMNISGIPMTPMNIYGIPMTPMNINGIPTTPMKPCGTPTPPTHPIPSRGFSPFSATFPQPVIQQGVPKAKGYRGLGRQTIPALLPRLTGVSRRISAKSWPPSTLR